MYNFEFMKTHSRLILVSGLLAFTFIKDTNAQAEFKGNIKDITNKKNVSNVKLMVITNNDTSYYTPDSKGNFNFKNTAGKTKICAVSDGYVSEINAVNTTNGSTNTLNIAMVPEAVVDASSTKRAAYDKVHTSSYKQAAMTMNRKACSLPGLNPNTQTLSAGGGRGILTAAEVNDFARWQFWTKLNEGEFATQKQLWRFVMTTRIPVQLMLDNNTPVVDAIVDILDEQGKPLWTARTDNTGKAELWPDAFTEIKKTAQYKLKVHYSGETFDFEVNQTNGNLNTYIIKKPCAISNNLDIAFVVDATGSMGDEINFIKSDLDTFIKQTANENKDINIRLGSVFYRDRSDEYLVKYSPFSSNSHITDNFILDQRADGGGDYPEAVDNALAYACDSLEWSESARARLLFLILDAGAHSDEVTKNSLTQSIALAAKKGIRIVPVICSGLNKADEVLMRYIALATNGTNVYLTNHSRTGNDHLVPSADHYKVETLSELLNRITRQFSVVPECDNTITKAVLNVTDSLLYTSNPNGNEDTSFAQIKNAEWKHHVDTLKTKDSAGKVNQQVVIEHSFVKIHPNPTSGILKISTSADITTMYLADVSGKLLQNITLNKEGITQVDLSQYSSGIYFLKYPTRRGWGAERVILQRN